MTTGTTSRTPLTAAQVDVLARTLDVVLADPDAWSQESWGFREPCGTTFCLAGHCAVTVLHYVPQWDSRALEDGYAYMIYVHHPTTGKAHETDVVAARALGLTDTDGDVGERASSLFQGDRTLRRLVELAYVYSDGRVDRFAAYRELAVRHPDVAAADARADQLDGIQLARQVAAVRIADPEGVASADEAWWLYELD